MDVCVCLLYTFSEWTQHTTRCVLMCAYKCVGAWRAVHMYMWSQLALGFALTMMKVKPARRRTDSVYNMLSHTHTSRPGDVNLKSTQRTRAHLTQKPIHPYTSTPGMPSASAFSLRPSTQLASHWARLRVGAATRGKVSPCYRKGNGKSERMRVVSAFSFSIALSLLSVSHSRSINLSVFYATV